MAIYITACDAETTEKKPIQSAVVQASEQRTYTQEEVIAMLTEIQKGEEK